MRYHPLIKYRVTARTGETFEGYLYAPNKPEQLWVYETSVWNGDSYTDEALRIKYDRAITHDFPFSGNEVRGKTHLATVTDPDVVVPVSAPLTFEVLLDEFHVRNLAASRR